MPEFVAFYPGVPAEMVLAASPRRATAEQAALDVQRAWHAPTNGQHATHMVVWRIDGETVRPMTVRVHRRIEVKA